ncbi:Amidase 1 [Cyphellophora attinorum]|uniref:Amidase 1 n=1 Tax=Cyphellophora attinorum TaxID=1664694 RepID=A0A0N1NZR8_9EURO|nr:Amidase 1 [Phialophora attinorum]KPI40773.1 Amidase 1 [Phialophora attinorum]
MRDAKTATAPAIQKLIDAGAVIVGKNKLSEFAFAGQSIVDHVDYLMPFNPRGDGYQSASDSSGGSAVAAASYAWLDASIGSDTGGSIRGPAIANGIHGNRPSHGAVSLEGAIPLSTSMDTCGTLARDPSIWNDINKALYSDYAKTYPEFPAQILINEVSSPDPGFGAWQNASMALLAQIALHMNATIHELSIDKLWNSTANSTYILADDTNQVYGALCQYEQWNEFGRAYISEYKQSHRGHLPHVVPGTLHGWQYADANITADDLAYAQDFRQMVANWSQAHFLVPDEYACSEAIHILMQPPSLNYKVDVSHATENPSIKKLVTSNVTFAAESVQLATSLCALNETVVLPKTFGMTCRQLLDSATSKDDSDDGSYTSPHRLASIAGLPHVAVTLGSMALGSDAGQYSTFSTSWNASQELPWGMTIMAAKGCDFMIQDLISSLYLAGIIAPIEATTGS